MSDQQTPQGGGGISWHLRTILDMADRISRAYYRRKHRQWAKEIGRDPSPLADHRGFILIQIDAVAYVYLRQAMDQGYVPFLASLANSGRFKLARWHSGQPSTTPAVQAGVMYGDNFDIPAFRWYEKERGASVVTKSPGFMAGLQQRISKGHPGIMSGGSSYVSMFDGDAALSLLTLGATGRHRVFENVRGVGFLILLALSPWSMVRILVRTLWEYLEDLMEDLMGFLQPSRRVPHVGRSTFARIANDVIFREIQTFAAMLDVYRGVPSIFTNFNSYDDAAHHYGANSRKAFRTLQGIDKQIQRIDRMRRRYTRREYDFYVMSDHGMTPSIPFREVYGQTLGEWILDQVGAPLTLDELPSDEDLAAIRTHLLFEELRGLENTLGPRQRVVVGRVRRFLGKRFPDTFDARDWDLTRTENIVVSNSGSVAHVYFNVAPRRLELSEISVIYPALLERLMDHPGIGMIVAREGESTVILSKSGRAMITDGKTEVEGKNPLLLDEEPLIAAEEVNYLASFPHSGDLIVFGGWYKPGVIVAFEEQVATHGGLGGPQSHPFILYPARYDFPFLKITNARQLYPLFANLYLGLHIPLDVHEEVEHETAASA